MRGLTLRAEVERHLGNIAELARLKGVSRKTMADRLVEKDLIAFAASLRERYHISGKRDSLTKADRAKNRFEEHRRIERALRDSDINRGLPVRKIDGERWDVDRAAETLGLSRVTLYRLIRDYKIEPFRPPYKKVRAELQLMARRYRTQWALAAAYDVSRFTVQKWLKQYQVKLP